MFNLGMGEITLILLLALLVIGPKSLPDLAATIGKIIRDLRKTAATVKNEIQIDDAVRKPFEELRDAITLSPDELLRRDRIKKELDDLQKKVMGDVQAVVDDVKAAIDAPLPTASKPDTHHEGELPASTEAEPSSLAGETPSATAAADATESESARIAAAHAPTLPAELPTPHGPKTLPFGSPSAAPKSEAAAEAPKATPAVPPGMAVPVRAPEGTVARASSTRNSQRTNVAPPPPPATPNFDEAARTLTGTGAPPPGDAAPALPHAASLPAPAPGGHAHLPPPPPAAARRTSPRLPAPLPGPSAPGAADRQNITQALSEEDIMAAAAKMRPPPPPPAGVSRPLPAPGVARPDDDKTSS